MEKTPTSVSSYHPEALHPPVPVRTGFLASRFTGQALLEKIEKRRGVANALWPHMEPPKNPWLDT